MFKEINQAVGLSLQSSQQQRSDGSTIVAPSLAVSLKSYGNKHVSEVIKYAKLYKIPVITNPELVEILMNVPSDTDIPSELLPALEIMVAAIEGNHRG